MKNWNENEMELLFSANNWICLFLLEKTAHFTKKASELLLGLILPLKVVM